jgi:DHA2 family multidrug resistance protein
MALSPGGLVVISLLPAVGILVSRVDTRILVMFGFSVLSGSLFYMSRTIDTQMDFATAVELRALQSVGMAFLFVPIQTISYAGVPPQKYNQVSGIMNLSRNMGADFGIAFVTTLIGIRAQTHQAQLSSHTTAYDAAYQSRLDAIARALEHAGSTSLQAARQATAAMYRQLSVQATQLAYLDALWVLGLATAVMVPLVWLTRRPQQQGAPAGH